MDTRIARGWRFAQTAVFFPCLLIVGTLSTAVLSATTVVPITDRELFTRADVVVHGIVASSRTVEDGLGRPETVTVIQPLALVKGRLSGSLVLHQLGGELPDGRFLKLWGRPEYQPGREVVVFAIARPEGDYQTAELLLGKFEVRRDDVGGLFAVPSLAAEAADGVTVVAPRPRKEGDRGDDVREASDLASPRELSAFLESLRPSAGSARGASVAPVGELRAVVHPEYASGDVHPLWDKIGSLWRYNNGASAVWTLQGQANVTGGATAEATAAARTWTDEPNSTINYTIGTGGANLLHLDALSSPCGWTTCMSGGGVIGCGGPSGGGTNSWRGETYSTITGGEVWLRSYCSLDLWDLVTTESVLAHELGHTLGLGHSDQGVSPHDVCSGDESLATMRSFVQHRVTLGTDDSDAVRWLYGDGGNSCGGGGPVLTVTKTGAGSGTVTSAPAGISCGTACFFSFADGAVVALAAAPASNSVFTGWGGDADCADGSLTMSAARSCTASFGLLPDLIVSSLAAPSAATAGSAISVSETTKNQGGAATASTTRYYLSTNSAYEAGDVSIGFRSVSGLTSSASSPATVLLTIPAGTATGNYSILARADADSQLSESNEANNVRAASIHIGPPDLVVSAFSVPTLGGAGLAIAVTDTTRNQSGTGPSVASVTRFYLSSDATLDASDVALGFRSVPALPPGQTSAGSTSLPIPPGAGPGTYSVIAKADADGLIAETSETDNTRNDTITIGPDLVVSALSAPATGGAGLPVTVTDTARNQGGGSTVIASTTSFYLSANSTYGAGDVFLGSRTAAILAPNATSSAPTTFTIPAATLPGSYYIVARADDAGAVAESNETNNIRAVLIRLSPDLIVSVLTVPSSAAAGSVISAGDTTKNQGQGTAAATTTKFYLSSNATFEASADIEIGSRGVGLLVSGASSSGTGPLTIPAGTAPGGYYILARADGGGAVAESNEGNNTVNKPITISP
jgi:subtilase family serine protease